MRRYLRYIGKFTVAYRKTYSENYGCRVARSIYILTILFRQNLAYTSRTEALFTLSRERYDLRRYQGWVEAPPLSHPQAGGAVLYLNSSARIPSSRPTILECNSPIRFIPSLHCFPQVSAQRTHHPPLLPPTTPCTGSISPYKYTIEVVIACGCATPGIILRTVFN